MLIIHGTLIQYRPNGMAAAFCPICRCPRRMQPREIWECEHVFYLPIGQQKQIGSDLVCKECGTMYAAIPDGVVTESQPDEDAQAALARLPEAARSAYEKRLDLEHRLSSLRGDERASLLLEPLQSLAYELHVQRGRTNRNPVSAVLQGLLLLCMVVGIFSWIRHVTGTPARGTYESAMGATIASAVLFGSVVALLVFDRRRFAIATVLPRLAGTLKPLAPTPSEIEQTLNWARENRIPVGALSTADVTAAMHGHATTI